MHAVRATLGTAAGTVRLCSSTLQKLGVACDMLRYSLVHISEPKKSTAAACEHLPGTLPSGAKKVSCAALHASRVCYVILWFAFAFSLFIRDVQRHCRG